MVIPIGFAQVNHIFAGVAAPQGAQVVYGVDVTAGINDPVQVAEDAHGAFGDQIMGRLCVSLTLERTLVKFGPIVDGPSGEFSNFILGSQNANSVPPNVSVLVSKKGTLGGRRNAGRMFLPGYEEAKVGADGAVSAGGINELQTALNIFLGDLQVTDTIDNMVILHSDAAVAPTPVNSLIVQSIVATQRRRLR